MAGSVSTRTGVRPGAWLFGLPPALMRYPRGAPSPVPRGPAPPSQSTPHTEPQIMGVFPRVPTSVPLIHAGVGDTGPGCFQNI